MAYQSQYSGAQIDNAVGKINAACNLIGAFYNLVIPVNISEWTENTANPGRGKFVITRTVNLPSINQNPYIFVQKSNHRYDVEYELNTTGNPQTLTVYSNIRLLGNIIIQSGAGTVNDIYTAEVLE